HLYSPPFPTRRSSDLLALHYTRQAVHVAQFDGAPFRQNGREYTDDFRIELRTRAEFEDLVRAAGGHGLAVGAVGSNGIEHVRHRSEGHTSELQSPDQI